MRAHRASQNEPSAELQALDHALAVIVLAPDGTVLRANANFLQLSGHKARELVGQPWSLLVPAQVSDAQADAALWTALRRGVAREVDCRCLRKDGSLAWLRLNCTPIADGDGQVVEVVAFATDVTAARQRSDDERGQIAAIDAALAVAHFALDGTLIDANARFLEVMGHDRADVIGQHHRIFVDPAEALGEAYLGFWRALAAGQPQAGSYRRIGQGGRDIWTMAIYTPIADADGQAFKVVNLIRDVTAETLRSVDHEGQIAAINKSHGVITFDLNGTVLDANDNFLDAVGYRLDEIEGRHHRMFVDASFAHGSEYANFWASLAEGRHQAGEYRRFGKNRRELWLQASYNPIRDVNGRPYKVVKYATVITRDKLRNADHLGQIASIHKAQCVISFELDGTVIDANDNFLDLTGYRLAEVRGRHHRMFVDEAEAGSAEYLALWSDLARGQLKAAEFKRRHKDGHDVWLQASYNPIFDMNGWPFKVVTYATDVTRERLLQADNEGQIAAIDKSQCVVAFDMDGVVLSANDNFLSAMGYARDELVGRHHRMLVDPAFAGSAEYQAFWDTLRSGKFLSERYARVGKGGGKVWVQGSYNPVLDLNGRPFKVIKIATDVTADVALAADFINARRQAHHDAATALPNRVGLTQFMTAALGHANRRLAILYLDLDHFKPINDTFGHHIGDHVLRETARRLLEAIGPDQIVARVGGDEFVVAAPNLPDDQIDRLCQRLIEIVQTPIRHEKCLLTVGLSIGVAVSPMDATAADDLLRCADVALYRTKGEGRGSYSFFAPDMQERLYANRHRAEELHHGIKAGQFFLEYQPRFNARTLQVHSVEIQVRWAHPSAGCLAPADFIGLAEKSGLIVPLGEWVLRQACQTAAAWPDIGISLSVSPTQFASSDFPQIVEAVVAESGLTPGRLELEMTERMFVDDADRARAGLVALKALGVRLTLDDYGTHHTSLDQLQASAFDAVKIDGRFMADIEGEADGRRIVRDIRRHSQALAGPLPMLEVEATGKLLLLCLDKAAEVQGYLVAPSMPADELSTLLQRLGSVNAPRPKPARTSRRAVVAVQ